MKEGEHMAYWVAIVDDSSVDAAFVEDILKAWLQASGFLLFQ